MASSEPVIEAIRTRFNDSRHALVGAASGGVFTELFTGEPPYAAEESVPYCVLVTDDDVVQTRTFQRKYVTYTFRFHIVADDLVDLGTYDGLIETAFDDNTSKTIATELNADTDISGASVHIMNIEKINGRHEKGDEWWSSIQTYQIMWNEGV
jgi:hypothetical protein